MPKPSSKSVLVAYIPVLHRGYINFLVNHAAAETLYILGDDLRAEFPHLRKDVRALTAQEAKTAIEALEVMKQVKILDQSEVKEVQQSGATLIAPDEDIMHELFEKYFTGQRIEFDPIFLRWDKNKSLAEQSVKPDEVVSEKEFDHRMMTHAQKLSEKSPDWWRQVGAVIIKDGKILLETYNKAVPSPQQPMFEGDPRGDFHKGDHIELSTAFHAEAALIADAARQGIPLEGATIYVTTFPCPNCAKLIAYTDMKELYYLEGYAMLDGERILKDTGVKIFQVKL